MSAADADRAAPRWSVRLLGAVEAHGRAGERIDHWPSRAVAALLARLALAPERAHAREELIELLWPGVAIDIGRNRLRQALSTLRTLLEPAGLQREPVLLADRSVIRVVPAALHCDALELSRRVAAGAGLPATWQSPGELMPGYYDQWIAEERLRLGELVERALAGPRLPPPPGAVAAPGNGSAPRTAHSGVGSPGVERVTGTAAHLPAYLTRAFGTEPLRARLAELVCRERLVTLHGPGGSGKTRLAVELAAGCARACAPLAAPPFERVVFVPLVACTTEAQLLEAAAQALGGGASSAVGARVRAMLEGRRVLMVLDNAEQLAPQADAAIGEWVHALPQLHLLVTSRRVLELDGETTVELEGLPLPHDDAPPQQMADNPAVALFVDRARAARADFRLGTRNAGALAALVRLLGGMPLAIELAATRVRSLSPRELLAALRTGTGSPMLDLLARPGQRASRDTRHASMRHMVAWSWRQLRPEQARLLALLSVFEAPADTGTVAHVAELDPGPARQLLDELHAMSLLGCARHPTARSSGAEAGARGAAAPAARAPGDEAVQHALLQPVREFAAEQLSAQDARQARARLRQWLLARAHQHALTDPAALVADAAHVHAALVSAPADGAWREALELAVALRLLWEFTLVPLPDMLALEAALDHVDDAGLRAEARDVLALGRLSAGAPQLALAHADAAIAAPLDDRQRSLALARWAGVRYGTGRHDEQIDRALDEALLLARRCGDVLAQAQAVRLKAVMDCNLRLDYRACESGMAHAQALWERLGNVRMARARLRDRAVMWAWLGRSEQALAMLRECAAGADADADEHALLLTLRQMGRVLVRMRRWREAAAALRRGLSLAWRMQYLLEANVALLHLPDALVHLGQAPLAASLQAFALRHWEQVFGTLNRIERREVRSTRLLLHRRLGAVRLEALRVEAVGWSLPAAVAQALQDDGPAPEPGPAERDAVPGAADTARQPHAGNSDEDAPMIG